MSRHAKGPGGMVRPDQLEASVHQTLRAAPVCDIHTHLFAPSFGPLLLWGIDDLLTYHYLAAEFFRAVPAMPPEKFGSLSKTDQADLVWRHLFVERSPLSEAARGVVTCLGRLGLEPAARDLAGYRRYFAAQSIETHLENVLASSGVTQLVMTNDPFDAPEASAWDRGVTLDDRFRAALRLDVLIRDWPRGGQALRERGYAVEPDLGGATRDEVRRFLAEWIGRIRPLYLALSPSPEFRLPAEGVGERLLEACVVPAALEHDLPLALMLGCRRQVNPRLGLAGDGVACVDMRLVAELAGRHPELRILATVLARENQHELVVLARKFANLHIFGCWWFMNTPSLAEELTAMRMELLGHTFTPQHSDARVLEQLIYKWSDARAMLARVLVTKYAALLEAGWPLPKEQLAQEAADLLGAGAMRFLQKRPSPA